MQSTDPGAVGFGYLWANPSTGLVQARNTANSAWVSQGNYNQVQGGALPLTGGMMQGAITGSSGFVGSDSPALTGSPSNNGVNLATLTDVANSATAVANQMNANIKSAIAAITGNFNISGQLAFGYGTVLDGATIPLPSYGGATPRTAYQGEIVLMMVGAGVDTYGTGSPATQWQEKWSVNAGTRVVTAGTTILSGGGSGVYGSTAGTGLANYCIVCVRAS